MKSDVRKVWRAALVLAALATVAHAGVRRDDVADADYQDLARGATDMYVYEGVGQLYVEGAGGTWWGSGTLVASVDANGFPTQSWVVTAAHVLDGATSVTFSLEARAAGTYDTRSYYGTQMAVAAGWNNTINTWDQDIGVVQLNVDLYDVTPGVIYTGAAELGVTATAVGYGTTGTGDVPEFSDTDGTYNPNARTFDYIKRAGTNVIDQIGLGYAGGFTSDPAAGSILRADFDSPTNAAENTDFQNAPAVGAPGYNPVIGAGDPTFGNDATPTAMEYSIAPGDSGGGLFANIGGVDYLIGVNAHIMGAGTEAVQPFELPYMIADADYGDIMGFTRVSSFALAINDTVTGVTGGAEWTLSDLTMPVGLPPVLPGNPQPPVPEHPTWNWSGSPLEAPPLNVNPISINPVDPATVADTLMYDALDPTEVLSINTIAQNLLDAGVLTLLRGSYNPLEPAYNDLYVNPGQFWRAYSNTFGASYYAMLNDPSVNYFGQSSAATMPSYELNPAIVLLGDANNDGVVSADDFAAVQSNFGNVGAADGLLLGDANNDGVVSADDFAAIQAHFGAGESQAGLVPEPGTMALLGLAGIAMLRRRRTA